MWCARFRWYITGFVSEYKDNVANRAYNEIKLNESDIKNIVTLSMKEKNYNNIKFEELYTFILPEYDENNILYHVTVTSRFNKYVYMIDSYTGCIISCNKKSDFVE